MHAASSAKALQERILVVEDEPDLQRLVVFNLRDAGFDPEGVGSGTEALAAIAARKPMAIVLDLKLPDVTGTEICRRVRADPQLRDVGVIICTARGDEYDRLLGFEVGADDYVVKPFSVRELVMRVRALVRRPSVRQADPPLRWRGIELDVARCRVAIDGAPVALRPLELKLLQSSCTNPAWCARARSSSSRCGG